MGYECPEGDLDKFVRTTTSISSRASSNATTPATNEETGSDSTVVGTDEESSSGSESEKSTSTSRSDNSFTLVERKNKKAIRKAQKKSKTDRSSPVRDMEIDMFQKAFCCYDSGRPIDSRTGHHHAAVRVADDGIKITYSNVETFRSLNKYLIDSKIKFHTYALEEERKVKAVIRDIPTDFDTDDIKSDLLSQGYPVQSVHRLCRRDGSPLWLVMAILPRTEEARQIFEKLSKFAAFQVLGLKLRTRGAALASVTAASGTAMPQQTVMRILGACLALTSGVPAH
ncbi:hypothetical protein EVAR_61709_1 [Eumeta japonica]|uniref:Pre-C2HC domain-containing protein n=1 Tax=Eumeta variegata TaxID=151549 RepID=A0A4C1ZR33_EUMVA|nr:hypothetical protein EVAR_61709_1 [Eumeta japonica]